MQASAPFRPAVQSLSLAKVGAFLCFGVAGGLMIATLMQPAGPHGDIGAGGIASLPWSLR